MANPDIGRNEGLLIKLSRIKGVTPPAFLQDPYYFQCPPLEEFSVPNAFEHVDYMTIKNGQYSRKSGRLLRTAQFQTLAVWWAPWVNWPNDTNGNLDYLKDRLEVICNRGLVVKFQATHVWRKDTDAFWCDWPATLRGFTPSERGGENDARYFDCNFTEWRDQLVDRAGGDKLRLGGSEFPQTHELKAGDDLYSLAKQYYGQYGGAQCWRWIADANGIPNWGPNTPLVQHARFKVGSKIKIPMPQMGAKFTGGTVSGSPKVGRGILS